MRRTSGFTLVEVAFAVACAAILVSLAVPAYVEAVRKARRSDAFVALTAVQQAQERRRANAPTYTTDLQLLQLGAQSPAGHYALDVAEASATGYTATATAVAGSPQAKDQRCSTLSVRLAAGHVAYGSACATCRPTEPPTDPHRCWGRS
jgi:type IV pilus assembly protein PilE